MERSSGESHSHGKTGFRGQEYDVFLNFRGLDTRHGFTDFLYELMTDDDVRVFLDDDEFHHQKGIRDELYQAIGNCRIYMAVFSKNYASSTWCLEELARMVDLCESSATEKMMLSIVSRYQSNPGKEHWKAVKRILRYLKGTADFSLCYGGCDLRIVGYNDVDWGGDLDQRKHVYRYLQWKLSLLYAQLQCKKVFG